MVVTSSYERVADLVSQIRNARYGEIVSINEKLIDSGEWMEFSTPAGTKFEFRPCEYDFFLAAQDIDPTLVRHAYVNKAEPKQLMRLADITGRGRQPKNGDRREREDVAQQYSDDPSGAGARIKEWNGEANAIVTGRTAKLARDANRRRAFEAGEKVGRTEPDRKRWHVEWHDERSVAEAVVSKLRKDGLADEVMNALRRASYEDKKNNSRSEG